MRAQNDTEANLFKSKNRGQITCLLACTHHTIFGRNVANYLYIYILDIFCMYAFMCMCVYVCVYVYVFVCVYVCVYVCVCEIERVRDRMIDILADV